MNNTIDSISIELYDEWMSKKNTWFSRNSDTDEYYTKKYYDRLIYINLEFLVDYINAVDDKKVIIGSIILLDQIPRHFDRFNYIKNDFYSCIASQISNIIIENQNNFELGPYDYCFIYLPYRHLGDIEKIKSIVKIFIDLYIVSSNENKKIYKRFINATLNKFYKQYTERIFVEQKNENIDSNTFASVLANNPSKKFDFQFKPLFDDYVAEEIKIVSLSGGVDSNVLLFNLAKISKNNIIAIHINYNNSVNSNIELNFVKKYCSLLGIKLYHRTIDEINRNSCHNNGLRDLYEDITKKIRYDCYKQIKSRPIVALGHNKDDCFENIITNILQKQNYDNLQGMKCYTIIDDITFWRPMLDISKQDIIQFAIKHNIPFLQDSTPKWCNRGKIRDDIVPCFQNFHKELIPSMFELAKKVQQMDETLNDFVLNKIISNIQIDSNNIIIKTRSNFNDILWKKILKLDFFENEAFSLKSIAKLCEFVNKKDTKITFVLSKNIKVKYYEDKIVCFKIKI